MKQTTTYQTQTQHVNKHNPNKNNATITQKYTHDHIEQQQ